MKELTPTARRLLASAREAGAPDAAARLRVGQALMDQIAIGAGAGAAAGERAIALSTTTLSTAVKGALVVGFSGAALWGGWQLTVSDESESLQPGRATIAAPVARAAALAVATASPKQEAEQVVSEPALTAREAASSAALESPRTALSLPAASPSPVNAPAPVAEVGEPQSRAAFSVPRARQADSTGVEPSVDPSPERTRAPNRVAAADTLAEEAQGLRAIQQALRSGDGKEALQRIQGDSERFAGGVLHQERAAARVQALCLIGSVDAARDAAQTFERHWPRSSLLARVRATCR
jgi:hypothetical protein